MVDGVVTAVSCSRTHSMAKWNQDSILLVAGLGVEGDAHSGKTVKHLARLWRFGNSANLRQVHLIHSELHEDLRRGGFAVVPGQMGENITTRGIDLLELPVGARLHLGVAAVIEITGLRNPCGKLNKIQPGLMKATLERNASGKLIRKAGIMGIVLGGGPVKPGDPIEIELPEGPHRPLGIV